MRLLVLVKQVLVTENVKMALRRFTRAAITLQLLQCCITIKRNSQRER